MNNEQLKKISEELIATFFDAGKISLQLREKGLEKKIKQIKLPILYFI